MDTFPISVTKFISLFISGIRNTGVQKSTSKNWPSTMLTATMIMTSLQVQADSWVSAGSAPSSSGGGFSLAAASKTSEKIGWGLGIVFNGEISGDDVLDYPVPHNNYTNLGTQRTGNAIGLDALWFPAEIQHGGRMQGWGCTTTSALKSLSRTSPAGTTNIRRNQR